MSRISLWERLILPDYTDTKQIEWGVIEIDRERCNGCGVCVRICPSDSLFMDKKKSALKPVNGYPEDNPGINQCMCCGDCVAICPNGALSIIKSYRWTRYFKTIGRGKLSGPRL